MIDLILQGPANSYTLEIAHHYLNALFVNNIIVSCWNGNNIESNNNRIIVIKSDDLPERDLTNRNRQIKSSITGLKAASTEFSAKLRADQKISIDSLYMMNGFYQKHKDRKLSFITTQDKPYNQICVAGMFPGFPFHPRDHMFWGKTEDLIDLFSIPYDETIKNMPSDKHYDKFVRSETYIASRYVAKFDKDVQKYIENPKEYLVDGAPKINEALEKSKEITDKIFLPFPKIDFEWPKYKLTNYYYDFMAQAYGEYWSEL